MFPIDCIAITYAYLCISLIRVPYSNRHIVLALSSFSHELKQDLPKQGGSRTKNTPVIQVDEARSVDQDDDDDEEEEVEEEEELVEEEEEIDEEEVEEEEVVDEEEEEGDESDQAQGGSSSHHQNLKKAANPVAATQKPVLQRRFAVDPENHNKTGVPIHRTPSPHHHHHPTHEPHPPPPAVAAPACPPTITESRRGPTEGGSTGGAHRPLQRSATLPANPQRNVATLQLANRHRIVHFCNVAVSIAFVFCFPHNWVTVIELMHQCNLLLSVV